MTVTDAVSGIGVATVVEKLFPSVVLVEGDDTVEESRIVVSEPIVLVSVVELLCSIDVVDLSVTVEALGSVLSVFGVEGVVSVHDMAADVAVNGRNVPVLDVCASVVFA